jgi:hypothetical protein
MNQASVSSVGQPTQKPGRKRPSRSIKITARVSVHVAGTKHTGMSWGDYIELLAVKRNKDTPYTQWQARNSAWAARSLDVITADLAHRFPITEPEHEVCYEAATSSKMIKKHYRRAVPATEAEAFWNITPQSLGL